MIVFNVPGRPQGKARARTVTNPHTGKKHSYTPDNTREYEQRVQMCYKGAKSKEKFFNKEPLVMTIVAYYEIPKSTTKKDRVLIHNGELYPTKRPDVDNIGKIIADALEGVVYANDNQIVRMFVFKEYTEGKAYVKVKIRKLTKDDRLEAG